MHELSNRNVNDCLVARGYVTAYSVFPGFVHSQSGPKIANKNLQQRTLLTMASVRNHSESINILIVTLFKATKWTTQPWRREKGAYKSIMEKPHYFEEQEIKTAEPRAQAVEGTSPKRS